MVLILFYLMFLSAEPSYRSHRVVCILIVDLLLIWLSFGTLVSFFFFFSFYIYVLLHATFNLQNERWEAATTRKGLGGCFFSPLCQILIISILSYYLPHEYFFILFSQIVGFQLWAGVFGRTWEGSIKYLF